jgi:hypothetical protein
MFNCAANVEANGRNVNFCKYRECTNVQFADISGKKEPFSGKLKNIQLIA